jgi:hypothetical protein
VVLTYLALWQLSRSSERSERPSIPASSSPDSESSPVSGGSGGPGGPSEPPSDDDSSDDECVPRVDPRILIPRKMMEAIIAKNGRSIWQAFQRNLTRDRMGQIWKDPAGDFRIDAGPVVSKCPKYKNWDLQVNQKPPSASAKNLLSKIGRRGTHAKLFRARWNVEDPPQYDAWVQEIMDAFG